VWLPLFSRTIISPPHLGHAFVDGPFCWCRTQRGSLFLAKTVACLPQTVHFGGEYGTFLIAGLLARANKKETLLNFRAV